MSNPNRGRKASPNLTELEAAARYSLRFVAKGEHPGRQAQRALDKAASDYIRTAGGMPSGHYGKYGKGDFYADRPRWSNRPYKTAMQTSSARAGRRGMGIQVHGRGSNTSL